MKKAISALCLFILALSVPLAARAQAVYGNIVGTVVDSVGRRPSEREGDHHRHEPRGQLHDHDQ